MADLRKAVPARYPIRNYPDITHSQQCQYPVPDWDVAFSLTEGREVINPRPRGEAAIFRYYQPGSIGFITYSEGCNDDVNKIVWSGLGWDPKADVVEILRQYGRAFVGDVDRRSLRPGPARPREELARAAAHQRLGREDAGAISRTGARAGTGRTRSTGGSSRPSTAPTTTPMSGTACSTRPDRERGHQALGQARQKGALAAIAGRARRARAARPELDPTSSS